MMFSTAATSRAGRSNGNVTNPYVRHAEAPSTRAASNTSGGIAWSPASKTYVVNGSDTKIPTVTIAPITVESSPSQSTGWPMTPSDWSAGLRIPK